MTARTKPGLLTEPLYSRRQGLWAEADTQALWLKSASGFFCGFWANGPLKWQLETATDKLKLLPLTEHPVKVRLLSGEFDPARPLKTKLSRRAPGQVRPNAFFSTQKSARYALLGYFQLSVTPTIATPGDFIVYPDTAVELRAYTPPVFVPDLQSKLSPEVARDSWELQRLMGQLELDVAGLLGLLQRYKGTLEPRSQKAIYQALTSQFERDLKAAEYQELPTEPAALSAAARHWAGLTWWQANTLAAYLVLEGLELAKEGAYSRHFELLARFITDASGERAWVYRESWFKRFGRGDLSRLAKDVNEAALKAKVEALVRELL